VVCRLDACGEVTSSGRCEKFHTVKIGATVLGAGIVACFLMSIMFACSRLDLL
jgi:hypothetical protein